MKKSQILAALALAFALGVVAPIAGASAYVLDGDQDSRTKFDAAVTTLTGKVNALGNCTEGSKNLYNNYKAVYDAIAAADEAIATAEETYADALKDARDDLAATMSANTTGTDFSPLVRGAGKKANNDDWKNYNGTEVNAYANYDALINYAKDMYNALMDAYNASVTAHAADSSIPENTEAQKAAELLYKGGTTPTGAIPDAEDDAATAKTTLNNEYTTRRNGINALLGATPFNQVTSSNTTYALAKGAALALPKYSNFAVVINQQAEIAKITSTAAGAAGYTLEAGNAALDQQEKNVIEFCTTNLDKDDVVTPNPEEPGTDKPTTPDDGKGEDNTDKVGTPNDGALAKAEGSTSASASIMAAIATALTAAGAAFIAIRRKIAAKKEA